MRRATTAPDPRRARRASRATARSSKLDDLVTHDLHGLVALAGDHDDVARPGLVAGRGRWPPPGPARRPRRRRLGMPARMASMMASGSSPRGLSEVRSTRSARRAATSPISGRLLAVTIAAGAEHHEHPPAGRGLAGRAPARRRARRACGRSRRARRTADPRRPARTGPGRGGAAARPVGDRGRRDAELGRRGGRGERVAHVEAAAERQLDAPARASGTARPGRAHDQVLGIGEGVALGGHQRPPRPARRPRGSSRFTTARRAVVRGEQRGLRLEVVVEVAVEVEVVVAEVREHGDGEAGGPHSAHGQRVRRHLHGDGSCAPRRAPRPGGPAARAPRAWCAAR